MGDASHLGQELSLARWSLRLVTLCRARLTQHDTALPDAETVSGPNRRHTSVTVRRRRSGLRSFLSRLPSRWRCPRPDLPPASSAVCSPSGEPSAPWPFPEPYRRTSEAIGSTSAE